MIHSSTLTLKPDCDDDHSNKSLVFSSSQGLQYTIKEMLESLTSKQKATTLQCSFGMGTYDSLAMLPDWTRGCISGAVQLCAI